MTDTWTLSGDDGGAVALPLPYPLRGRLNPTVPLFRWSSLRGAGFFRYCASMKRILIIEDDKDIVELVRYNLEREGFHVTTAGDGVTGLAQIKKFPPDLLVLDLMLPR